MSIPAPRIGWEPVYELLCCLRQVTPDPDKRAEHAVALVAGMQAGAPIDEWLLVELLSMAGIDMGNEGDRGAAGRWMATLTGAGLLSVTWGRGSTLRPFARNRVGLLRGGRARDRHRDRLTEKMRLVEDGLRRAMDILEEAADEEG